MPSNIKKIPKKETENKNLPTIKKSEIKIQPQAIKNPKANVITNNPTFGAVMNNGTVGKEVVALKTEIHVNETDDLRIEQINPLIPPAILMENFPLSRKAASTVKRTRFGISNVLKQKDSRLVCIVGPCSIHDPKAALEYANKLVKLSKELQDDLLIVMRVYFEKPRTTVGWKGLINDPFLDRTFSINKGLSAARKLLMDINELGLPCGVEYLDTIVPQFIGDLVSWGAIGARTTESQVHRELTSGLSCPVGFKNGTMGSIEVAAAAIKASSRPHHFLSVTKQGLAAIVETQGNPSCHTILRGGKDGPNFDPSSVAKAIAILNKAKVSNAIMIDCSHGNSQKIHSNQPVVAGSIASQIRYGNKNIVGVMIESFLHSGKQSIPDNLVSRSELKYGVSVTDSCLSWEHTEPVLQELAEAVRARRAMEGRQSRQYISAKI